MFRSVIAGIALLALFWTPCCYAAGGPGAVAGKLILTDPVKHIKVNQQAVVWLARLDEPTPVAPLKGATLTQQNKKFSPHLLAVTVGTLVAFPNKDPFFHNVFSIYQGKPFDLGLYESGSTRSVRFVNPGVSYIFCNIHPEMSAVVVVLTTPYFAVTDTSGAFRIEGLPVGRYQLNIWYEGASEQQLSALSQKLNVGSPDYDLPTIEAFSSGPPKEHKNKYGESYHTRDPYKF
jgi:plastocyanin